MTRIPRSCLVVAATVLVLGGQVASASAALLWKDGFSGNELRPAWTELDARWRVRSGALRVDKATVDDRTHVGYAVVDLGGSHRSGLRVSSQIRLSPGKSNVGLVAPFRDVGNHLFCKVEITPGHPDGKAAMGRRSRGGRPTLLRAIGGLGLHKGAVYRLTIERRHRIVACAVRREGALVTRLRYTMTAKDLRAFGRGTKVGVRIKVIDGAIGDDEDDGRSRFLDFRAMTA